MYIKYAGTVQMLIGANIYFYFLSNYLGKYIIKSSKKLMFQSGK